MLPRVLPRAYAWQDDGTLWADDLRVEPANPYAAGNLGHHLVGAGQVERGLQFWRRAVETAPPHLAVFPVLDERYKLAQAAFLHSAPTLALEQTERLIEGLQQAGRVVPANAWCLLADSLDAVGRHVEASQMEGRCGEGSGS